jgi:hypothetical protein
VPGLCERPSARGGTIPLASGIGILALLRPHLGMATPDADRHHVLGELLEEAHPGDL